MADSGSGVARTDSGRSNIFRQPSSARSGGVGGGNNSSPNSARGVTAPLMASRPSLAKNGSGVVLPPLAQAGSTAGQLAAEVPAASDPGAGPQPPAAAAPDAAATGGSEAGPRVTIFADPDQGGFPPPAATPESNQLVEVASPAAAESQAEAESAPTPQPPEEAPAAVADPEDDGDVGAVHSLIALAIKKALEEAEEAEAQEGAPGPEGAAAEPEPAVPVPILRPDHALEDTEPAPQTPTPLGESFASDAVDLDDTEMEAGVEGAPPEDGKGALDAPVPATPPPVVPPKSQEPVAAADVTTPSQERSGSLSAREKITSPGRPRSSRGPYESPIPGGATPLGTGKNQWEMPSLTKLGRDDTVGAHPSAKTPAGGRLEGVRETGRTDSPQGGSRSATPQHPRSTTPTHTKFNVATLSGFRLTPPMGQETPQPAPSRLSAQSPTASAGRRAGPMSPTAALVARQQQQLPRPSPPQQGPVSSLARGSAQKSPEPRFMAPTAAALRWQQPPKEYRHPGSANRQRQYLREQAGASRRSGDRPTSAPPNRDASPAGANADSQDSGYAQGQRKESTLMRPTSSSKYRRDATAAQYAARPPPAAAGPSPGRGADGERPPPRKEVVAVAPNLHTAKRAKVWEKGSRPFSPGRMYDVSNNYMAPPVQDNGDAPVVGRKAQLDGGWNRSTKVVRHADAWAAKVAVLASEEESYVSPQTKEKRWRQTLRAEENGGRGANDSARNSPHHTRPSSNARGRGAAGDESSDVVDPAAHLPERGSGSPGAERDPPINPSETWREHPEARAWLAQMGLGILVVEERAPALENPLRSGRLLGQLYEILKGHTLENFRPRPKTFADARENIASAVLGLGLVPKPPPASPGAPDPAPRAALRANGMDWKVESLLMGDMSFAWDLINRLSRSVAPEDAELINNAVKLFRKRDMRQTINWLSGVGYPVERTIEGLKRLEEEIFSGDAFLRLCRMLTGRVPVGVVSEPRTERDARRNLLIPLKALGALPDDIGPIAAGEVPEIKGLLQQEMAWGWRILAFIRDKHSKPISEGEDTARAQQATGPMRVESQAEPVSLDGEPATPGGTTAAAANGQPSPQPAAPQSSMKKAAGSASGGAASSEVVSSMDGSFLGLGPDSARAPPPPPPAGPNRFQPPGSRQLSEEEAFVRRSLERLRMGPDEDTPIEDLCMDGTLLCRLLELLDGSPIEGVQRRPKAPGHMLLNQNKAITTLRKNPALTAKIPGGLASEMVKGVPGAALRLLVLVFANYKRELDRAAKTIRERRIIQGDMRLK